AAGPDDAAPGPVAPPPAPTPASAPTPPAPEAAPEPPTPEPTPEAPAEPAPAPGFLTLDAAPWADVSLGGRALGTTPLLRLPLPPGRHRLRLKHPDRPDPTVAVVEIVSGETTVRRVELPAPEEAGASPR
ncbi:MAG: PEGA domain-containing protein, partial [Myxococcota bacterium]